MRLFFSISRNHPIYGDHNRVFYDLKKDMLAITTLNSIVYVMYHEAELVRQPCAIVYVGQR